ncbi:hypothetical protein DVK02_05550 [Halobellus sp. Atlit-31R]|nr:hypothetical protein DVK02_05550 [Halobellus sp. Atlit-31R]
MSKKYTVVIVAFLVVLTGCTGSPQSAGTSTPESTQVATPTQTHSPARPASLDQRLYGLATAEDPAAYASETGLTYHDGSVEVVIELTASASLPESYDVRVELRQGRLVQGYVAVDDLVSLARHENVSVVRPPKEPQPT